MDTILADPMGINIPKAPAMRYALCEMMGSALTPENADDVLSWANRLPADITFSACREKMSAILTGSRNGSTSSRYLILKPEKSAGLSACPIGNRVNTLK